jgi:hypothetical protein
VTEGVAILSPYQLLARGPQNAKRSILLAPPTNAFLGLAYATRTRDVFLGAVAIAAALSEVLGIFLSNIPFQVTETFLVFQISLWTAVGILSFMVLVILGSFFVKWPSMPVDPSTIAGAMYYISDLSTLDRFEELSMLKRMERDNRVRKMGLLYGFTDREDTSGRLGMRINTLDLHCSIL